MSIPVFVINLKSSESRKNHITTKLNAHGISYEIIEAVDGKKLTDHEISKKVICNWQYGSRARNLVRGEIGCVLSHFTIYEKMITENIEIACILEDDAEPDNYLTEILESESLTKINWDLLFLGHHSGFSKKEAACIKKKNFTIGGRFIGNPLETPVGSYGYLIKKCAAAEILKFGYPVRKPMDFYIGSASAYSIKVKVLSPPCISHNYEIESTIHPHEIIYNDSQVENIRRQVRKLYRIMPFLQPIWLWVNSSFNLGKITLRRIGLLKISFPEFD
jgi:glycosyl transferase family 25